MGAAFPQTAICTTFAGACILLAGAALATAETPSSHALDGFDSPYLGHTGSWDGKGGAMFGWPKWSDLDAEKAMGLRWTFMPVHWNEMEPDGPVDLEGELPEAWEALDKFVIGAHNRGLNILFQAPVVGGNAGGPPDWAGRREEDKSAPADMDAAAAFARKLVQRYAPGGTLAVAQRWGDSYGVQAWELDNEPDGYRTCWDEQAGDYAEFATRVAAAIKSVDPAAVIVLPGSMGGRHATPWTEAALDAAALRGSPVYRERGVPYSIGPVADAVSFHVYEGLDSFFSGEPRPIEKVFAERKAVFDRWANRAPGFEYDPDKPYWHTEGNYDFLGLTSQARRASWRWQFFTRAFHAGVAKVCVMDASDAEQTAVRLYVAALPDPFPMHEAADRVGVLAGTPDVFVHEQKGTGGDPRRTWIAWNAAGENDADDPAVIEIPVVRAQARLLHPAGDEAMLTAADGFVRVELPYDDSIAPSIMVIDGE
jgi:hypothetical protein